MKKKRNSIAVFCGSAMPPNPVYIENIRRFAHESASRELTLVYGGASVGLMGVLANASIEKNGKIIGVFPRFFSKMEIAHNGIETMIYVDTMAERKKILAEKSDVFVVFPGGFGTMDEMFEMLTMTQLDFHQKPLILFNSDGFYEHLYLQLKKMCQDGFISEFHFSNFAVANSVEEIFELIEKHKIQKDIKWLKWAKNK